MSFRSEKLKTKSEKFWYALLRNAFLIKSEKQINFSHTNSYNLYQLLTINFSLLTREALSPFAFLRSGHIILIFIML